jgi:hypothetical protein
MSVAGPLPFPTATGSWEGRRGLGWGALAGGIPKHPSSNHGYRNHGYRRFQKRHGRFMAVSEAKR